MTLLSEIRDEYEFLDDRDERSRLIIDLGRDLEPMPEALKTDATKVRGCQADVWTYPTRNSDGTLHFLADSNSGITKGIIALLLLIVQNKSPREILGYDIEGELVPFNIQKQLTSNRTSGIPNMIALIRATAERYSSAG